jgi:hypothetical protein
VPLLPAAPSAAGLLQPPSISISATAESATRTLVEDVFMMHPFLKVEDRQPHKTKSLQAGWLLDIDVLPRPLFRKKAKLDRIALISIKIHRFSAGFLAAEILLAGRDAALYCIRLPACPGLFLQAVLFFWRR